MPRHFPDGHELRGFQQQRLPRPARGCICRETEVRSVELLPKVVSRAREPDPRSNEPRVSAGRNRRAVRTPSMRGKHGSGERQ